MMSSKPVPIESQGYNSPFRKPVDNQFSKSLGDYSSKISLLQRYASDVSRPSYSGYLLKRSNRPYNAVSPFPIDNSTMRMSTNEHEEATPSIPRLQPKISFGAYDNVSYDDHSPPVARVTIDDAPLSRSATRNVEPSPLSQNSERAPVDQSAEFAKVFFGLELPLPQGPDSTLSEPIGPPQEMAEALPMPQKRSAPIKVVSQSDSIATPQTSQDGESSDMSGGSRAAAHRSQSVCSQPQDLVDPVDGHLWRAKYCVMEEGTLFFYSHQSDAESPEAVLERQQLAESNGSLHSGSFLAQSPVPTSLRDSGRMRTQRIWEKRVALDSVGAVRSAEMEYGKNSFELCAVDESDDDKLVLRAGNAHEMSEWLFQFHRAMSSFVMNIMDNMAPLRSSGDIHHPTFAHKPLLPPAYGGSPARSPALTTFSPRYQHMIPPGSVTPSLSHGHGRNALHRRRAGPFEDAPDGLSPSSEPPPMPLEMSGMEGAWSPRPSVPETTLHARESERRESSPEFSAPQSHCPEMERPPPSKPASGKYVPPHLRAKSTATPPASKYIPPHLRAKKKYVPPHMRGEAEHTPRMPPPERQDEGYGSIPQQFDSQNESDDEMQMAFGDAEMDGSDMKRGGDTVKLGGCADPSVVVGSILDQVFIPRKASRLRKVHTEPFGRFSAASRELQWEIGAVSECGVRESNEDSYLIATDLIEAFVTVNQERSEAPTVWDDTGGQHRPGLFAVFDGHCGDQAARFAAERLPRFIFDESIEMGTREGEQSAKQVEEILRRAIMKLDTAFCDICVEGGRAWESGATALVAALVKEHLIIANLGDARGIMSRSVESADYVELLEGEGWNELPFDDYNGSRRCLWKELTDTHSPNRDDERHRIQEAHGWVTTEKEIPIGQLKRMDLFDTDVIDILTRCFADRYQPSPKAAAPQRILEIARVCGELAVSRSLGDRDFKAAFNRPSREGSILWEGPLLLPYPDDHGRCFSGDLVTSVPEFQAVKVGERGVSDEFLLLACDGLWDVMDPDDAVRVTRALLFEKQWPAKKAAARLAELAIHLGSSDNITVIVVRFLDRDPRT